MFDGFWHVLGHRIWVVGALPAVNPGDRVVPYKVKINRRMSWLCLLTFVQMVGCLQAVRAQTPRIAIITELSGPNAAIGDECRAGAEVAGRYLAPKTKPVELVYGDSQDEVRVAVSEFNRFAADPRVLAVVVSRSKTAIPLNPLSARSSIALFATAAHPALLSGNPIALRAYLNARVEGEFLARHAFRLGYKRIAMVTVEDEWNQSFSEAFQTELERLGGSIVLKESIQPSVVDMRSFVGRIRPLSPDAVFVNLQVSQAGPFIKRLREAGVTARLLSNYWVQKEDVTAAAGHAAVEGVLFGEVDSDSPKYLEMFRNDFPQARSTAAAYICYVAVAAAIETIGRIEGTLTRESVAQSVKEVQSIRLMDGNLKVIDREIQFPMRLYQLQQGKRSLAPASSLSANDDAG